MTENQNTKNLPQRTVQQLLDTSLKNPKRDYHEHCETIYDKNQVQENEIQELGSGLKKKHQNLISMLLTTLSYDNQNHNRNDCSNKDKEELIQSVSCQYQKSGYNQLASSTQQDSSYSFLEQQAQNTKIIQGQNTFQQLNEIKSSQNTQGQQKHQEEEDSDNILLQNQSVCVSSSDSDYESGQETTTSSVMFIPFQKTEEQIIALKIKQEQLIKRYTPLNEQQILPWINGQLKSIEDPIIRFHQQIMSFYFYLKPTKYQHQKRLQIFNQVKDIVISIFPQSKVFPFGSFATCLYLPDGDIDIVALIKYQTSDYNKNKEFYKTLYRQFRKNHRKNFTEIKYVSSAKVPLVKMVHRQTGYSIDLSLNTLSGLQQIRQVGKINKQYPEFKFIVFVLKVMLKIRNFHETFSGGVGSFLLTCMIFHFVRYVNTDARKKEIQLYGLGELILNFFRFYFLNVDFWKQTIHVKTGQVSFRPRKRNSFSMISPFDQGTDIGRKAWKMRDIFAMFKNRYKVIKQRHFQEGQSILKQLINPAMVQFEYYDLKKDQNITQKQEDNFMEEFSNKLLQQIQSVLKKENKPKSINQKQQKLNKKRKFISVKRNSQLKQTRQNNDEQKKQDQNELYVQDSTSY